MLTIIRENEILESPEIVFSWIAEPEKAMQWQKNVKGGEILENKPETIGTTFKEVIEEDGKSLEMYGVITKYVENRLIGFHIKSKIHEFDVTYSLEETDKATKISVELIIKWKFPVNIISLFTGRRIERNISNQLDSEILELKSLCETD